jgi:hypothetical protein
MLPHHDGRFVSGVRIAERAVHRNGSEEHRREPGLHGTAEEREVQAMHQVRRIGSHRRVGDEVALQRDRE